MKYIIFIFLLLNNSTLFSQIPSIEYLSYTNKADSLFIEADFELAVKYYTIAFEKNNGVGKVFHRYKLAAAFTQLKMIDSAFIQLERIANKGKFKEFEIISNDILLFPLHNDKRWLNLMEIINLNLIEFNNQKNKKN